QQRAVCKPEDRGRDQVHGTDGREWPRVRGAAELAGGDGTVAQRIVSASERSRGERLRAGGGRHVLLSGGSNGSRVAGEWDPSAHGVVGRWEENRQLRERPGP